MRNIAKIANSQSEKSYKLLFHQVGYEYCVRVQISEWALGKKRKYGSDAHDHHKLLFFDRISDGHSMVSGTSIQQGTKTGTLTTRTTWHSNEATELLTFKRTPHHEQIASFVIHPLYQYSCEFIFSIDGVSVTTTHLYEKMQWGPSLDPWHLGLTKVSSASLILINSSLLVVIIFGLGTTLSLFLLLSLLWSIALSQQWLL